MLPTTSNPEAGKRLRAERERLRLSTRDVERLSYQIAEEKKNQDYYLSHAWISDIEKGKFVPGIYKLYSLSLIYKRSYDDILAFFGICLGDIGREQRSLILPRTYLIKAYADDQGPAIVAPTELRDCVGLAQTNLVSRMFERWAEIPCGLLQQMDLRRSLYGYIGMEDYTLYPLIRPGSFVQIDSKQRKIGRGDWLNEFDRPIYFVELRDHYVCSWCELNGSQLILIPTSQSRAQAKHVRYPDEADVVGRVTAVTMRITGPEPSPSQQPVRGQLERAHCRR
jgi:transcriptional regulator with XRE-family HTH domain